MSVRPPMLPLKPPLGLKPRRIHQSQRLQEILEAIQRYEKTEKEIPSEWIEEYNEILEKMKLDFKSV